MSEFAVIEADKIPQSQYGSPGRVAYLLLNREYIDCVWVAWDDQRTQWRISIYRTGGQPTCVFTVSSVDAQDIVRSLTGQSLVLQVPMVTE